MLIEVHDSIDDAILREKRLKNWNRVWKCRLISEQYPNWDDLWDQLNGGAVVSVTPDDLAAPVSAGATIAAKMSPE